LVSDFDDAESSIREVVWAKLSGWLVKVSRRVLRGQGLPPDVDQVYALEPAWREAVERSILPVIRRVYESVMGTSPGDGTDARVFLAEYLAEVRNRLVRVPEEVYDTIAGDLSEGVNLGESIPELTERVDETLSTTGSERWQNRATMIARTEAIGALNAARLESFRQAAQDEPGVTFEKVWVATVGDGRTRPSHVAADGQRVPVDQPFIVGGFPAMFPGDPSLPPELGINCRCTMLLTEPLEEIDYTNRQYRR
jgi:SPP1 gp7 family putative phage head morphogenesis protein